MSSRHILLLIILVICISLVVSRRRRRRRSCSRVDCQVSPWSSWSACSAFQCGKWGTQQRTRTVQVPSLCGGTPCPSLQESQPCQGTLRVDCKLSPWSIWSACSQTCGGSQTSTRYVATNEQCGGTPCSTTLTQRQPCSLQCFNQGTLINKKCSCSSGYYGSCCQYRGKWKLIEICFNLTSSGNRMSIVPKAYFYWQFKIDKNTYQNRSLESRIWEKIEGQYAKILAKIQVKAVSFKQDMRGSFYPYL